MVHFQERVQCLAYFLYLKHFVVISLAERRGLYLPLAEGLSIKKDFYYNVLLAWSWFMNKHQ